MSRGQRVTIHPREAAAVDRLLDAYLATDEHDPGLVDLERFRQRVRRLEHDHAAYDEAEAERQLERDVLAAHRSYAQAVRIHVKGDGRCHCLPPYTDTRAPHPVGGRARCLVEAARLELEALGAPPNTDR